LAHPNRPGRRPRTAADPASFDELAGEYAFDDNGVHLTVHRDGARLLVTRNGRDLELIPVAPLEVEVEAVFNGPLRVERDRSGRIVAVAVELAVPRRASR